MRFNPVLFLLVCFLSSIFRALHLHRLARINFALRELTIPIDVSKPSLNQELEILFKFLREGNDDEKKKN